MNFSKITDGDRQYWTSASGLAWSKYYTETEFANMFNSSIYKHQGIAAQLTSNDVCHCLRRLFNGDSFRRLDICKEQSFQKLRLNAIEG